MFYIESEILEGIEMLRGIRVPIIFLISIFLSPVITGGLVDNVKENADDPSWLTVIKPNGGEVYSGVEEIIWENCGIHRYPYYDILLCYNLPRDQWFCIAALEGRYGRHSYLWDTEVVSDGESKIRVECWYDTDYDGYPDICVGCDESDGWFTVINGPYPPDQPSGPTEGRPNVEYQYSLHK